MKSCELSWSTFPDSGVPANVKEWVLYSGSFMRRLIQYGIHDARIQVLQQGWQLPQAWEGKLLAIDAEIKVLVREVLILSEKKKWMFARTVIPEKTLTGKYKQLAQLEDRSLGSVLFQDPEMRRGEFEFASLQTDRLLRDYPDLCNNEIDSTELWVRRSIFSLQKNVLLLTEVFLPDMATL